MSTQIGEILTGTVDGLNTSFSISHVPDPGSLNIVVDGVAATITSQTGTAVVLSTPPPAASVPFAYYTYASPADIDLTTLALVKSFGEIKGATEDSLLQTMITAFSRYIMNRTGRTALNQVLTFSDVFDGNGSSFLLLPEFPVTALTLVNVAGVVQTLSSGFNVPGIRISQDKRGIMYAYGHIGRFYKGLANVMIEYSAGYAATPEDLSHACSETIVLNYKRRGWTDMKSKSTGAAGVSGTTAYQDWEIPPHADRIISSYERKGSLLR
jgi:hypothetical protein